VLVPIALADTLLRVAERGLYRPLWSQRILGEAQDAVEEIHPGIDAAKRFASMREVFDDALVTGWEELEPGIHLPDEDDRHVVAATVRGGDQASSPRTRRTSQPPHLSHSAWRQSIPATSERHRLDEAVHPLDGDHVPVNDVLDPIRADL
jgi:hypothetical protein